MNTTRILAAITALSLAGACGGSSGDDLTGTGNLGTTFSATVIGGSAGSYSGFASAVPSAGLFSIGMSSTDGKFALAFTRNGTRPATGTYQLGTNPQLGFSAAINVNSGQFVYSSTSGTLDVTSSSATEIKGNFSFTGSATAGGGAAANVSGSFTAACPVGC